MDLVANKYLLSCLGILFLITSCFSEKGLMELRIADRTIFVEIANTDQLRAKGLMKRKSLKVDNGMLFVFDKEEKQSFWMKNTLIPLSIAYISKSGEIKEIHDMKPLDEDTTRSSHYVMYALEMNKGWFENNGISIGDRILIPDNL